MYYMLRIQLTEVSKQQFSKRTDVDQTSCCGNDNDDVISTYFLQHSDSSAVSGCVMVMVLKYDTIMFVRANASSIINARGCCSQVVHHQPASKSRRPNWWDFSVCLSSVSVVFFISSDLVSANMFHSYYNKYVCETNNE